MIGKISLIITIINIPPLELLIGQNQNKGSDVCKFLTISLNDRCEPQSVYQRYLTSESLKGRRKTEQTVRAVCIPHALAASVKSRHEIEPMIILSPVEIHQSKWHSLLVLKGKQMFRSKMEGILAGKKGKQKQDRFRWALRRLKLLKLEISFMKAQK